AAAAAAGHRVQIGLAPVAPLVAVAVGEARVAGAALARAAGAAAGDVAARAGRGAGATAADRRPVLAFAPVAELVVVTAGEGGVGRAGAGEPGGGRGGDVVVRAAVGTATAMVDVVGNVGLAPVAALVVVAVGEAGGADAALARAAGAAGGDVARRAGGRAGA